MNEYEYEEINETYEYGEEIYKTNLLYFPEKNIATVTETTEDTDDIDTTISREGMTKDEIAYYFPSQSNTSSLPFNLSKLIRSIIYEAHRKEGESLEPGNVRNFWYTHLKTTITKILGLGETDSVLSTINQAWGDVVNAGLVTYEGLNIIGGKETSRISVVKDSPFSNLIIAVEKVDYFDYLSWVPKLFNSTLITAGGQPSRAVARAFIRQLESLGVDLGQDFYMCVASDLDPAGYYIQEAFRKQFEAAIRFYGGSGHVIIKRLFVRRDQVSENLLKSEAMPCRDKARSDKARKAEDTKWDYFCAETDGGLYIPVPPDWNGPIYEENGHKVVRALLEMNAFPKHIIEKAILKELLRIIQDTNDESKIMIPEIMRIFEIMRNDAINEVFDKWKTTLIKPLIDAFLHQTDEWESEIRNAYWKDDTNAEEKRDQSCAEIDDEYETPIDELEQDARNRVPSLYKSKERTEAEIEKLKLKLINTNEEIADKCADIFSKISTLENEREEKKAPISEEYDRDIEEATKKKHYRMQKLKEFREEHATIFNPLEMSLKSNIADAMSPEAIEVYFKEIEKMDRFKPHIARLLVNPDLLLDDDTSCFVQPIPTFTEQDLLQKASQRHDENIEKVRSAFPAKFTNEMKAFLKEHIEDKTFEIDGGIEAKDLDSEITEAKNKTEEEIEAGQHDDIDEEHNE